MQRVREENEAAEVRLDRSHARDPSTKRLTTTDDLMTSTRCLDEDGDRALRSSARKIHREGIDSASLEADYVGLHRRRIARCSMTEDDSHHHYRRSL
jgi:hypothetical protein